MQEHLLRVEPPGRAQFLSTEAIEAQLRAIGLAPRFAVRTDRGWWVQVAVIGDALGSGLKLPDGWKLTEELPVLDWTSWPATSARRAVGNVFTFALLLWPAVVGLFVLSDEGWQLALKIALVVWLGLMHLIAYRQEQGAFLGNSLLMLSGCVAGFWWTHPGPWMYVWLLVILVGVHAAVRGALQGRTRPAGWAPRAAPSGGSE